MNRQKKYRFGIRAIIMLACIFIHSTLAQSQIFDFPLIDIVVLIEEGQTRFEFFWKRVNSSSPAVSVRVSKLLLSIPGGGPTVWRIISPDTRASTASIVYGIVPPGFYQTVPDTGKPPPLDNQQRYRVDVEGEGGGIGFLSFIYNATQGKF